MKYNVHFLLPKGLGKQVVSVEADGIIEARVNAKNQSDLHDVKIIKVEKAA